MPITFTPVPVAERDCREKTELNSVELTGLNSNFNLRSLERRLWIMDMARVERSTAHIWAATPRAAARLELCGWQVVLFSDEDLGRVDPNLPGFLEPVTAERRAS